jgi:DNA polymerase-3 subunit delta'
LSRKKDKLDDVFDMILTWCRDLLVSQVSPDKILNRDFAREIEAAAQGCSIDELFEKLMTVQAAQTAIQRNSNPRLTLEVMLTRLCHEGGKQDSCYK